MKLKNALPSAAIAGLFAATAQANVVTHTGSTTADPTYARVEYDLSGVSNVGTAVRYDTYTFRVDASGTYTFLTTGEYDTFATLYSPAFGAATPLVNAKAANDDLLSFNTSGLAFALVAGVPYTYITTGYSNTDSGVFSTTIGGAGAITPAVAEGPAVTSPLIYTRTGDTTNAPTFDRPTEDRHGLSTIGATAYDSFKFRVTASGDYTFLTTGVFDTFDLLYSPTLDPTSPLTGLNQANDDLLSFGTSGFVYGLLAGVDYTLVTTGFDPTARGFFSSTIGGPGSIVTSVAAVPEPGVVALIFTGLAAIGLLARRRKAPLVDPRVASQAESSS